MSESRPLSDDEIISHAIKHHPDCTFGRVVSGMTGTFEITRVVLGFSSRISTAHSRTRRASQAGWKTVRLPQ